MKYRTICVDPPWRYEDSGGRAGIDNHYNGMSHEELLLLPVGEWAECDQAHLYLWTTNGFMEQAHQLVRAWGFQQKTILTWIKPGMGMGRYFRNSTEHILFCARGNMKVARNNCLTHFGAPKARHSAKPEAFYDMVESMSPGPYLDVFARRQRLGWSTWGNECYLPEGMTL